MELLLKSCQRPSFEIYYHSQYIVVSSEAMNDQPSSECPSMTHQLLQLMMSSKKDSLPPVF